MKLVIIGVPSNTPEELIQSATVAFSQTAKMDVVVRIIDTKEFDPNKVPIITEKEIVENALEEIVKTCVSSGHDMPSVTANFWRLIHDGKISPDRIKLLNKHQSTIRNVCAKYHCPCLSDMFKAAGQFLSL